MIYLLCTNFRGYNSTQGTFVLAVLAAAWTDSKHGRKVDLRNMPRAKN
jgi:hypothetical protein